MIAFQSLQKGADFSLLEIDGGEAIWRIGGTVRDGQQYLNLPAAETSIAMVTSMPISMSSDTLASIFNGSIVSWADVNSTMWPDAPIRTIVRTDESFEQRIVSSVLQIPFDDWGSNSTFETTSLACVDHTWPLAMSSPLNGNTTSTRRTLESNSVEGMLSILLRVPYSIGFLDAHRAKKFENSISIVEVDDTAQTNMTSGRYTLSGTVHWDLSIDGYENCLQAVSLVEFVLWTYESEMARSIAEAYGFKVYQNLTWINDQLRQVVCLDEQKDTMIPALDYANAPRRQAPSWVNSVRNNDNQDRGTSKSTRQILWMGACMVVVCIGVMMYMRQFERRNLETFWRIRKKEIIFAQPQVILGSGSFGQVLLASYRGTQVAVKRVIPNNQVKNDDVTDSAAVQNCSFPKSGKCSVPSSHTQLGRKGLIDELKILTRLRHNNITTVVGAVMENRGEPMIVMEYMEQGSLYNLLHHSFALDGELILPILQDIVQGMRFLHSADRPIIHSDLKAKNVLLDQRFRAKITDFGLSIASKKRACGSPFWMAPELLNGESKNTTASDVYAFGMVLFEIFTRKTPFEGENPDAVLPQVRDWAIKLRPSPPYRMSSPIRTIFEECLTFLPGQRPTAEELDSRLNRLNPSHLGCGIDGKSLEIKETKMPQRIKQAVLDGADVPDETKEVISIIVADVHNLAPLYKKSPKRVAVLQELEDIFRELAEVYDLTIPQVVGDTFVAIGNMGEGQANDHAKRCAMMATDLLAATEKILLDPDEPTLGCVQFRVAIHCGPVTCRVIGSRHPRIALFSDETVHFSHLLQKSGQPGRIQCIHKTFCVLRKQMPELKFALRGRIPVKGSGTQNTYWINEGEAMPQLSPKKVTMPLLPKKMKKSKHATVSSPSQHVSPTKRNYSSPDRNLRYERNSIAEPPTPTYYTQPRSLSLGHTKNSSPIPRHSIGRTYPIETSSPLNETSPYQRRSSLRSSRES